MNKKTKYLSVLAVTSLFAGTLVLKNNVSAEIAENSSKTQNNQNSLLSFLSLRKVEFLSVEKMKNELGLKVDDVVETLGYYNANDGGAGRYIITKSGKVADDGSVIRLNNGLTAELIVENNTVNVKQFGVRSGLTKNEMGVDASVKKADAVSENTKRIQNAINFCSNDKTLFFPAGWFLTDTLNLGSGNNITIKGVSNSMGTYLNKTNGDTYSKILFSSDKKGVLFNQEKCMMILEDIAFYGSATVNGTTYGAKNKTLVEGSVVSGANDLKGKIFTNNCEFAGWNTVFGGASLKLDKNNEVVLDSSKNPIIEYKDSTIKENSKVQVAVLATNCRFSNNNIAISQLVDGRIAECSFNKNGYGIVLGKKSGYSTITNSRIEWSIYNGILLDSTHDVTITNNELDRSGYAGMHIVNSETVNINGNILRRSGANEQLKEDDTTRNVHFYIKNNKDINVSNNVTKVKFNYDHAVKENTEGKKGIYRPSNVSTITNNKNLLVTSNILNGGNRNEDNLNIYSNNTQSIRQNNIVKK